MPSPLDYCRVCSPRWRATALCLVILLTACRAETVAKYTTRGVVRGVTQGERPTRVAIWHEALPAFEDRDGQRATMPSMTMEFALAPRLEQHPPTLQEKLRFDFEVRWDTPPFLVITRIERLPKPTRLELSAEPN